MVASAAEVEALAVSLEACFRLPVPVPRYHLRQRLLDLNVATPAVGALALVGALVLQRRPPHDYWCPASIWAGSSWGAPPERWSDLDQPKVERSGDQAVVHTSSWWSARHCCRLVAYALCGYEVPEDVARLIALETGHAGSTQ